MKKIAVSILDLLLAAGVIILASVALSGGGRFEFAGQRVSFRSVGNGLTVVALLAGLRVMAGGNARFIGTSVTPEDLGRHIDRALSRLALLPARSVFRIVALFSLFGLGVRLLNAWLHPGFFGGDDVEIHEMTFSVLYDVSSWRAWDLRSPFYPLTFIYPVQLTASWLGVTDPGTLVFAGRAVVAVLSTLIIPLTFYVARAKGGLSLALIAGALVATSALLTEFGGTELPRPVAAVLVLTSYYLASRQKAAAASLSGAAAGLAATLRFSEVIFMVPLLLQLALERRTRDLILAAGGFLLTFAMVQFVVDVMYWGAPFASARAIVDYTLVSGLSSRGYQPWWHYLLYASHWTTVIMLGLAAYGISRRTWQWSLWAIAPLVLLSCLPHKEPRYLIPIYPFVVMLAAAGLWRCLTGLRGRQQHLRMAMVGALVAGSVVHQINGMHIRRSDAAVAMARWLTATSRSDTMLIEQGWRLGGRIHLGFDRDLIDADAGQLRTPGFLEDIVARHRPVRIAITNETCGDTRCQETLLRLGYTQIDDNPVRSSGYVAFRRSP